MYARTILPPVLASRYLIQLVGPFHTVEVGDVSHWTKLTPAEREAMAFVGTWVDERVVAINAARQARGESPVTRQAKPHVVGMVADQGKLTVQTWSRGSDFGYFAATSTAEDAAECYRAYTMQCGTVDQLPAGHFSLLTRHQQLATATLLVTSDRQMVLVRRSQKMFLHPVHVHSLGGQVELGHEDVLASAMFVTQREAGVGMAHLTGKMITCLGVCGNDPHDQPIALVLGHVALRQRAVVAGSVAATAPDGGIFFLPYNRRQVSRLLKEELLTPSLRALLYLLLYLPKEVTTL